MKRAYQLPDEEPQMMQNFLPSETNHNFQVMDVYTCEDKTGQKMGLDKDIVVVRCEVAEGAEAGRNLFHRLSLDMDSRGFYATRLFLKAIGQPHKGKDVVIDTDIWPGKRFSVYVVHNKGKNGKIYANIDNSMYNDGPYDFSKMSPPPPVKPLAGAAGGGQDMAWDE